MKNKKQRVPTEPVGCFLDYTYCANPDCKNECGRKMTDAIKKAIEADQNSYVAYGNFCGICR